MKKRKSYKFQDLAQEFHSDEQPQSLDKERTSLFSFNLFSCLRKSWACEVLTQTSVLFPVF